MTRQCAENHTVSSVRPNTPSKKIGHVSYDDSIYLSFGLRYNLFVVPYVLCNSYAQNVKSLIPKSNMSNFPRKIPKIPFIQSSIIFLFLTIISMMCLLIPSMSM